jgi:hypothetical protein
MAHDDTFQRDPDRESELPYAGSLRTGEERHERVEGPDLVDKAVEQQQPTSGQGTAGVVLGAPGLPDRDALLESGAPGTANVGAALQRATGLGGTRGDDESIGKTPGEVSGVGGTQGTGAGTGNLEGSTG